MLTMSLAKSCVVCPPFSSTDGLPCVVLVVLAAGVDESEIIDVRIGTVALDESEVTTKQGTLGKICPVPEVGAVTTRKNNNSLVRTRVRTRVWTRGNFLKNWQITNARGIDGLTLAEHEVPTPGANEVLVRVRANSINYRDLTTILDPEPRGIVYPRVPNSDGAGDVVAVGKNVNRFRVGDRVAGIFFQKWIDGAVNSELMASAMGGAIDGMLSEYVVLDQAGLVSIPVHLSYEQAATLPCAAVTAWHSLVHVGNISAGDTVLLIGTGGVSIFALQFAVLHGARVIITSSSDEKLERARALGAWQTINYRDNPGWDDIALALTDGNGVDHVVETGGAGTLSQSVQALRIGGSIGLIGVLTGGEINPTPIMRKSLKMQGIYVGSRAMFEDMNKAIEAAALIPVVDREFTFEDAPAAYHHMQGASHLGKITISMSHGY